MTVIYDDSPLRVKLVDKISPPLIGTKHGIAAGFVLKIVHCAGGQMLRIEGGVNDRSGSEITTMQANR